MRSKYWAKACLGMLALCLAAACSSGGKYSASAMGGVGGVATAAGGSGAADSNGGNTSGTSTGGQSSFVAAAPAAYVAKVKNILTGLAPTDDEVTRVARDSSELRPLIGEWMMRPEYRVKMLRFFELAFQQTQIAENDFADQAYPRRLIINGSAQMPFAEIAQESFGRTMLALIDQGRPLTDALTTTQFMLPTALKEVYAFLDVWEVDDAGKVTDAFKKANPKLSIYAEAAAGPISLTDSLDANSPNYMHFYDPDVPTAGALLAGCAIDPIVYPSSASALHHLLWGSLEGYKTPDGVACPQYGGSAAALQLTSDDFTDWTLVEIRAPKASETVTPFYDLASLRKAKQLVLTIPRVGFFSTPAFFANWQTNVSNQMRVTLNQALIVALGTAVDGLDATQSPANPPGLDAEHAGSADCYFCHRTLDPLRSIFSATYSWNYHNQIDPALTAQKGQFIFHDVVRSVNTMSDFGAVLAEHPLFAQAWVQKLCFYVNSSACSSDDPEFKRVVQAFSDSNFSFPVLLTELLSSPLVTNAARTKTADDNGEVLAVSRRDHLCAAIDSRLGFTDICGIFAATKKQKQGTVPAIAAGLPSDGYGRGSAAPVLPNDPTLFYRAGLENICESVAAQVIDVPSSKQVVGVKQWSSSEPDTAIADFVSILMSLGARDPRAQTAASLLSSHFMAAKQAGESASNALKSTFVTACLSPSFVSIGL